jgi:nucleoid-associated protein YgaU
MHARGLRGLGAGIEGKQRAGPGVFAPGRGACGQQGSGPVRRENKLALIVGFSVLLVVAVLVSDHLSQAQQDEVVDGLDILSPLPEDRAFVQAPLSDSGRIGDGAELGDGGRTAQVPVLEPEVPPQRTPEPEPEVIARGWSLEPEPERIASVTEPIKIGNGPAANPFGIESDDLVYLLKPVPTGRQSTAGGDETSIRVTPRGGKVPGINRYTIREGDTLFEICEKLLGDGTRWREVARMNKGKVGDDGQVYVNVTIDLPDDASDERAAGSRPTEVVRTPASGSAETRSYTVRKGDTLSEIVMREVGSVRYLDRVRALNPWLKDQKDNIRVGQSLMLPVMRQASNAR